MEQMILLGLFLLSFCASRHASGSNGSNQTGSLVPAVIVFGDSIVDTGNNNALDTVVKCDFPPYGGDFPGHIATGRFSNGKIPSDFIASLLGVKEYLPAYLWRGLQSADLLTGVTFASGGSGFDPLTAEIASVISMPEQMELFREYKQRVRTVAGEERAARILSGSIYVVCAGSDDVANNYFAVPLRRKEYDMPSYANLLLRSAVGFVEDLIHEGAKRIGIVGIPPIGCVPSQRTLAGGIERVCATDHNEVARLYNVELAKEVHRLKSKYPEKLLVYINIYDILLDIIQHPLNYGFEVSTRGCCGTGKFEVSVLCNSLTSTVCNDVSKYIFWDSYHPTEKAYKILMDWVYKNYIHLLV